MHPSPTESKSSTTRPVIRLWINGRFLGRKTTGVERVAHELLAAISTQFLNTSGQHNTAEFDLQFHWALPSDFQGQLPAYGVHWPSKKIGTLTGHAWEQWSLARHAPNDWVINLCNTAPLFRRQQVVFFHDAQVFALPQNFSWRFRLWYRCLLQCAGRRARILLTNSFFSQSELAKFTGISADKFKVIHLGIDHILRLKPELPEAVRQLDPNKKWMLAVSSASPNKNFAGAVNAAMGANMHLVIAGQTYSKVFQQASFDQSNATQLGYVSDEELAGLYQHAACLVYPSFYEGFGLPPLEAMQMGCPVVVSQTSSLPEVCGDAGFYCNPSDANSITEAVKKVIRIQEPELSQVRQNAIRHASQFTWQRSAEHFWQHLLSTLPSSQALKAKETS